MPIPFYDLNLVHRLVGKGTGICVFLWRDRDHLLEPIGCFSRFGMPEWKKSSSRSYLVVGGGLFIIWTAHLLEGGNIKGILTFSNFRMCFQKMSNFDRFLSFEKMSIE